MSSISRGFALRFCLLLGVVLGLAWATPLPMALADKESKTLRKKLERAIRSGEERAILSVIRDLGSSPGPGSVDSLLYVIPRVPSPPVHQAVHETLLGFGAEVLDEPFTEALHKKKGNPLSLAALLAVAGEIEGEVAENWLIVGLQHTSELVQRNSIEILRALRSKRAITHLIAILEEEGIDKGTVSFDAHHALIDLTRRDFSSAEDWRSFWDTHGATLDPKKSAEEDEDAATGVRPVSPDAPSFFGVELVSRRVVFVIDISGSMTKWDAGGEKGGKGSNWEVRQRIRRTKSQLVQAIDKLAKGAQFNVVAFSNRVQSFRKSMVLATRGSKGQAARFIKKLNADGATHTDEALQQAFLDPHVDTIVLLSDGAPMKSRTEGAAELIPRILEEVRELNRLRKVRIHTFGFDGVGKWPPGSKYGRGNAPEPDPADLIKFLKELASEHRGKYTSID